MKSPKCGYIRYINTETVLQIVSDKDSLLKLTQRTGDFLVKDEVVGIIYTNTDWDEESIHRLASRFVVGQTKTVQQDLEFSIQQMVEIASKALSPGVNDPYTAITCIDNLTSTMCYLSQAKFPPKYLLDEEEKLRVIADVIDFQGVLNTAFNQIRQFSAGSAAVIIRLMEALLVIRKFAKRADYQKVVNNHIEMVLRLGKESITEQNDIADLERRLSKGTSATSD